MSKRKIIIIGVTAVAVLAIVLTTILFLINKEDTYRVIKVLKLDGTASVERENVGTLDVYEGMTLQSGDMVWVNAASMVVLQMDDDKYAYAEQNTIFTVVAEGTQRESKTQIELVEGVLTCQVENKLNESSSYEVHTQNSVMAVRGTTIQVAYWHKECMPIPGVLTEEEYTLIEQGYGISRMMVLQGRAATFLRRQGGALEQERDLEAGWMLRVVGEHPLSGAPGSAIENTRYLGAAASVSDTDFSIQGFRAMGVIAGRTEDLVYSADEISAQLVLMNQEEYDVYFMYGDILFGVQKADAGACAAKPDLQPTESGKWNMDFAQPIHQTTYVYWRAD